MSQESCPKIGETQLVSRLRHYAGPLLLPIVFILFGIIILGTFRAFLTWQHLSRFADTPGYLWLFVVGLRMDLILLSYLIILPTLLLLTFSSPLHPKLQKFIAGWCAVCGALFVYMEIATFPFMDEFDLRPDQKFLEYLKHVREVATTILSVYGFELFIGAVALITCTCIIWRSSLGLMKHSSAWGWRKRLAVLPMAACILVLGARSSIGHRPANLSTACFSENHLANELALNSTYTMLYAAYRMLRHEKNPSLDYGKISEEETFQRVLTNTTFSDDIIPGEIPFLHRQDSPFDRKRPLNVVIFLQESMGASDVGCLKGPDITPNLCRLKNEGIWFNNLYATGTRTVRGIEAVVSGFLPTSAVGVLKLGLARKNFVTAASLLQRYGYSTNFIYGGMSNFDEMKSFFLGNGIETIHDEPTFVNPVFHGTWGVSDEDLVRKANEVFVAQGDKPFLSLILSTSNHVPYEFPDGRISLYEEPKQTHYNAIKYADYAIGLFFELAKKERYFDQTIFLVVADHNSHVRGNDHVPLSKFHIPGLIIGPNIKPAQIDILASQIDLLPTLLHFTGLDTLHPLVGRNLNTLPAGTPGRAFMQYASNNAYMVGDDVIIHRPHLEPLQFKYDRKTEVLSPAELNPELAKDALAHAHLPWLLYSQQKYRLPPA